MRGARRTLLSARCTCARYSCRSCSLGAVDRKFHASVCVHFRVEFGSILENTSWTTEDAMAMIAGGPAAEEIKGESNVCMPSSFPEDVEPPAQPVADIV